MLGIMIALGLEQAVEASHERRLAREAREAIHAEMQEDLDSIAYRMRFQACNERRLAELTALLGGWRSEADIAVGTKAGYSALLPLMPKPIADNYWKLDAMGAGIRQKDEELNRARNDGFASVDVLRSGIAKPQPCAEAAFNLRRLKNAQSQLYIQTVLYQVANEQALQGAAIDTGVAALARRQFQGAVGGSIAGSR